MKEVKEQEYKRTEVRIGIGEVQQKMKMKMKNKFKTKEQGEEKQLLRCVGYTLCFNGVIDKLKQRERTFFYLKRLVTVC